MPSWGCIKCVFTNRAIYQIIIQIMCLRHFPVESLQRVIFYIFPYRWEMRWPSIPKIKQLYSFISSRLLIILLAIHDLAPLFKFIIWLKRNIQDRIIFSMGFQALICNHEIDLGVCSLVLKHIYKNGINNLIQFDTNMI